MAASYKKLFKLLIDRDMKKKELAEKAGISNCRIYLSCDNLFTITSFPGLDPEVAATVGYPAVRQYSIGLNVSF